MDPIEELKAKAANPAIGERVKYQPDDPEDLKKFAEEHKDELHIPFSEREAAIRIRPRTDGVFPKIINIREMATKELVLHEELDRGGEVRFTPPMSGYYTLEIIPKHDDDDDPQD